MREYLNEDDGAGVGNVTQVSNTAPGEKISIFGDPDDWYSQLLEIRDYNLDEDKSLDRTLFAGNVKSLITAFKSYVNDDSFSKKDKTLYNSIIDELSEFPENRAVTIIKTNSGLKFVFNTNIKY